MSRNNDVFQVLVTEGNQSVLGVGQGIDDLAPKQIGVFDSNTNLSIDGSAPVKNFYLAVGIGNTGSAITDISTSAGQVIQSANLKAYSFRPHTPAAPQIIEIDNFKAECDTDYAVKFEFRNQQVYRRQGTVQFAKTYAIRTDCCEGCEDCPSGDQVGLAFKLANEINIDEVTLATAEVVTKVAITAADQGTTADYAVGDVVPVTEAAAILAWNKANAEPDNGEADTDIMVKLRITTKPLDVIEFCDVNIQYFNPRGTLLIASLVDGFNCNGTVETIQELVYEEGSGYDVKQREYKAGAWNGRPGVYSASSVTGLAVRGHRYFANVDTNYNKIALTYDQESIAGWLEHKNNLATEIAIPSTDTTTTTGLLSVLDGIFSRAGFDELADDFGGAGGDTDETVIEATTDQGQDQDGLA